MDGIIGNAHGKAATLAYDDLLMDGCLHDLQYHSRYHNDFGLVDSILHGVLLPKLWKGSAHLAEEQDHRDEEAF